MDTINKHPLVFCHAFIAIHHNLVLAVGCEGWQEYADKDTRIIDGRGHIAVPGFIEVKALLSASAAYDSARLQSEEGMEYMRNGTLTLASENIHPMLFQQPYFEMVQPKSSSIPICTPYMQLFRNRRKAHRCFCISSYGEYPIQDQLRAAQLLGIGAGYDAWTLLCALTVWPAKSLGRKDIGYIHRNAQADILLFAYRDIQDLFHTLGAQRLSKVIKKGICVFPKILIS